MADDGFRYSDSNYDEPQPWANDPATMYIITIIFLAMALTCASIRIYVRCRLVRSPGWDDLFVGLGLLTTLITSIAICVAITSGLGKHFLMLTPYQMGGYLLMFYIGNASYVASTTFIKVALMLQYLRSYEGWGRMRRLIQGAIIVTSLWGFAYSFLAWIPCFPVYKFWYGDTVPGHCYGFGAELPHPFVATFVSQSALNMALDVFILLIGIPLLLHEEPGSAGRLRLLGLLSVGCIVIGIAAWRLQTMIEHQAATYPTRDPTWYGPISLLLSVMELDLACVCASIPIFWPMVEERWDRIFVTREVKVTSEERPAYDDEDRLTQSGMGMHSRSGSDSELRTIGVVAGKEAYYRDSFVLRQIDPLRAAGESVQPARTLASSPESDDARRWVKI